MIESSDTATLKSGRERADAPQPHEAEVSVTTENDKVGGVDGTLHLQVFTCWESVDPLMLHQTKGLPS